MYSTMQQRRDSATTWASVNPVLAQGEVGVDLTALAAGKPALKVGDGSRSWTSLPYSSGSISSVTPVTPVTANYTAAAGQLVPCNAVSGAFTVTLPAAPADGTNIVLKKTDASTNVVTFVCGGSDVFNVTAGSTSGTLVLKDQAVRLQYYAASSIWYVISADVPLSQSDSRYAQTGVFVPADYGGGTPWISWSGDPLLAYSNAGPTAGFAYFTLVPIRVSTTVTNVILDVVTAGATLTSGRNFAGLFNSAGTLLSATADQSTNWASTGVKTMALTAPQAVTPGNYYVGYFSNGTTTPKFSYNAATLTTNGGNALTTGFRSGIDSAHSGLTTAFTSPATITSASPSPAWVAVS